MTPLEAKRNFEHDQELLELLPYPGELTQSVEGYEEIVIEGPGASSGKETSKLLKCRKFGSHLNNDDCLLFAFSDFSRKLLYEQFKKKNPYIFRNCVLLLEETSDLDWLVAVTMGWIQLEDCQIYKVQDFDFRSRSDLPVQENFAIPGAVPEVSRLFVLLLRMGLLNRLTEVNQMPDSTKLEIDDPENVSLSSDAGFSEVFKRSDLTDYLILQELKKEYASTVSLNSSLEKFSNSDCLKGLGISQVELPAKL